ncbi:MAG TPA: hypothetical protein VHG90_08185 [Acidimicrobiales bacterium]|nr:hypothetical protein [Acidimicrobiales bacterium]
MRSARSTPAVLVVPAAVLVGHWLGYLVAGSGHEGSHAVQHGYLPAVAAVALPALAAAVVWAAVSSGRSRGHQQDGAAQVRFLVAAQWAVFVLQELIEHALVGDPLGVLSSPALWLGLCSQVAVAAAAGLLLRAASWAGGRSVAVLGSPPRWRAATGSWPVPTVLPPATALLLATVSPRGPPRRFR